MRHFAGIATTLCILAILWLTLVPQPLPEADLPLFPGADKVAHALMFGGLAVCILFDRLLLGKRLSAKWVWITAGVVALFGGVIEIAQWGMALGRGCELLDWLADIAGAIVCGFLFLQIARCFQK